MALAIHWEFMTVLSTEEKRTIAGRARTLQERLATPAGRSRAGDPVGDVGGERTDERAGEPDGLDEEELDELVAEWQDRVADGDPGAFRARLDRVGIDERECRRRLAAETWPDDEPLPDWVDVLDDLIGFVADPESPAVDLGLDGEPPFRELLVPVVAFAREGVEFDPSGPLAESARTDLTGWVAGRLSRLWARALFIDFKTYVAERNPDAVFGDETPEPGATRYYDEFVDRMSTEDRLRSFFLEYSFLGRLMVSVVGQWRDRVAEFQARVSADLPALGDTFAGGDDLGAVTGVDVLGDHHHRGRAVFGVTFDSGTTVGYKPRNAGIFVGFFEFVEWINEHGDLPDLRTLDVCYREDYSWVEWVRPEPCSDREEVVEYYRRAGMIVCLFYAFAATDMHIENIVAVGPQPVPIDLETVSEPVAKPGMRRINEAVEVVADTVVRTGVVPRHEPDEDLDNMAGFSVHRASVDIETQRFTNVNTDRMDMETVTLTDREGSNLPVLDGEVVDPRDHSGALVEGFEEMYRFLLDNEAAVLAEGGPVDRLADRETRLRVVYRPSSVYGRILAAMRSVDYLRTGLGFGLRVEELAKLPTTHDVDPAVWSVCEAEWSVLGRYNAPRFTAEIRSTDLYEGEDRVATEFFVQSPLEQIRERIAAFSEADLDEQRDYLRWGYAGRPDPHSAGDPTPVAVPDEPRAFDDVAGEAVRGIYDRIEGSARDAGDGPVWVVRRVEADGGLYVRPIDDALYEGRTGVGVFLAALDRVLGDERYGRFARETVGPVLAAVDDGTFENDPSSVRNPPRPVGGATGLGSVVYGLTKMGELLEDPGYYRRATRVAELIDDDRIAGDDRYGVVGGSAGAILGLLALYEATGERDVLERARRAGEHLLANATDRDGAPTWVPSGVGRPLCGFSHGTAGIAYALTRLGAATETPEFGTVAAESLAFERRQFDDGRDNWPDRRPGSEGSWMDAWCHGRTGVGLARLGSYETDPTDALGRDVRRAVRGADPSTAFATDHVCCGNFGRVAFLQRAARTLDEPGLRRDAERLARDRCRRADEAGQFSTQWGTDHWGDPGFFGGEAGIGYALLRLRDPSLPCVLLWE